MRSNDLNRVVSYGVNAIGEGYSDWLSNQKLKELNIIYQKRHILSHNEGIVHKEYLKRSADNHYKLGQRIIVSAQDVELLLLILEKLKVGLDLAINKKVK